MAGSIEGKISTDWASSVSVNYVDIWRFNRSSFESVEKRVQLQQIGGLVVAFTEELITPSKADEIARTYSLVNLAFGELGRLTNSFALAEAAKQRDSESDALLSQDLMQQGSNPFGADMYDALWLVPDHAIEEVQLHLIDAPSMFSDK